VLRGLLITFRPEQWIKNVLVAAAPLAAGVILHAHAALHTAIAFVAFCLASSAGYCLNDVLDAEADRGHPRKRLRPVAAGVVPARAALLAAVVLAAAAVGIATPNPLRLIVLAYLAVTAAYTVVFKHEPVIELALVASGFLLRAVAGGPATGVPLSQWFLIVAGFGSLFVVAGKRLSELVTLGPDSASRPNLVRYSTSYLRAVVTIAAAVTMSGYALWAFEVGASRQTGTWAAVSVAPFVVAVLRYALDVDAGRAEEPEQILLHDRALQALALLWLATFAVSALAG
jgi:decaprenyl-phosphate phosphoribosyltransferase